VESILVFRFKSLDEIGKELHVVDFLTVRGSAAAPISPATVQPVRVDYDEAILVADFVEM
jgi:hypothetical protein